MGEIVVATGASRELDDQTLSHEVRSMESRDDIPSVHGILVLNEAESIHKLDLGDLACAMGREVRLNVCFSRYTGEVSSGCPWKALHPGVHDGSDLIQKLRCRP